MVFDMLIFKKRISGKERATVKKADKKLMARLNKNEFKIDKWMEKVHISSAVRKVIEDYLYVKLSSSS